MPKSRTGPKTASSRLCCSCTQPFNSAVTVGLSVRGNGVAHTDEVNLRRAGLVPRWVTVRGYLLTYWLVRFSRRISLRLSVFRSSEYYTATSTTRKQNGKFCVTVGLVTRTAGPQSKTVAANGASRGPRPRSCAALVYVEYFFFFFLLDPEGGSKKATLVVLLVVWISSTGPKNP